MVARIAHEKTNEGHEEMSGWSVGEALWGRAREGGARTRWYGAAWRARSYGGRIAEGAGNRAPRLDKRNIPLDKRTPSLGSPDLQRTVERRDLTKEPLCKVAPWGPVDIRPAVRPVNALDGRWYVVTSEGRGEGNSGPARGPGVEVRRRGPRAGGGELTPTKPRISFPISFPVYFSAKFFLPPLQAALSSEVTGCGPGYHSESRFHPVYTNGNPFPLYSYDAD